MAASGAVGAPSSILVASALAARQWEWHYAGAALASRARAWETPPLRIYDSWLEERWLETADATHRAVITRSQAAALWRRVVTESATGATLIGHAGVAEWAATAWSLLGRWGIEPTSLRPAADEVDLAAFAQWARRYRQLLRTHDWIEHSELESALSGALERGAGTLVIADLGEDHPARAALFAHLASLGTTIRTDAAPRVAGRCVAARLPDAQHELRAGLRWARERLSADATARIALVVPTLRERGNEVERCVREEFGREADDAVWSAGESLATQPTIGAAVTALALLEPATRYATFGRWLRSSFFGADAAEQSALARLDRELRGDLRSQLPFARAYTHHGLRELLHERAPQQAAALSRALAEVETNRRAAPSRWAHLWTRFLERLGWRPPAVHAALLGWRSALDELAQLTPVLGEITLGAALAELERILQRGIARPMPLAGVHLVGDIDDVGPGYAAAWVMGFTDTVWPEPPRGNPLLPLALQRRHAMPYSSPSDALRRSAVRLERLLTRVPHLVISWPARVYDYEAEPSPALGAWATLPTAEVERLLRQRATSRTCERETVADAPPPLEGARVPGGSATLGRQARCPVRAFCEHRLGARALEPIAVGLSPRLRGIGAHRAAELLMAERPSQAEIVGRGPAAVAQCVENALGRIFGRTRRALAALFALEAEQLARVLHEFLAEEGARAPFRVRAVEERTTVTIGRWSFDVRIDRIDELTDGGLAIVDYKTSERATGADWFAPRLRDAQVPLYATHVEERVAAAVIARLAARDVGYSGAWSDAAFPGRRSKGAHEDLRAQVATWRAQLEALVAEFAAGDTRILVDDTTDALGSFAPLTRALEQLALAGGTTQPW